MTCARALMLITVTLVYLATSALSEDLYLASARASCLGSGALIPCSKYKLASYLQRVANMPRSFDLGPLRLVSMQRNSSEDNIGRAYEDTVAPAPEYAGLLQFARRQAERFLSTHGFSLALSGLGGSGPQLVYDDGTATNSITERGIHSKKKLQIVFPLMALLKFGIIKAMLIPILLGILFMKKVIVLGVMVLPSILSMLKVCKVASPYHHATAYHHGDYQAVPVTGSDYSYTPAFSSYGAAGYDSYGKDWSANQRKTRWGKSSEQLQKDQA